LFIPAKNSGKEVKVFDSNSLPKSSRKSLKSLETTNDQGRPAERTQAAPILRETFRKEKTKAKGSQEEKKSRLAPHAILQPALGFVLFLFILR